VVAGRPQPSEEAATAIAEAVFAHDPDVTIEAGLRYGRTIRQREMADGTWEPAEAACHPDPLVEAIRWQICEAEVLQCIGRARGLRRNVAIYLLTDVVLPEPIARTVYYHEMMPTRRNVALARGVSFTTGKEAAKAYPDLWVSADAFRNEKDLKSRRADPYKYISIGKCPPARMAFQPIGKGQKYREILVRHDLVPGIKPWLEERLEITVANIRHPPVHPTASQRRT
jgi:hypothetical protein